MAHLSQTPGLIHLASGLLLVATLSVGCGDSPPPPPPPPEPPPAPVLLPLEPQSPSQSREVTVRGTGAEPQETVRIYLDGKCQTPAATGTGEQFLGPGITVTVPENGETLVRADVDRGEDTACSEPLSFVHDTIPPETPVVTLSSGSSMPNRTCWFTATVTTAPHAPVYWYRSETCDGPPSEETADEQGIFRRSHSFDCFSHPPQRHSYTVRVADLAGNQSACSEPFIL